MLQGDVGLGHGSEWHWQSICWDSVPVFIKTLTQSQLSGLQYPTQTDYAPRHPHKGQAISNILACLASGQAVLPDLHKVCYILWTVSFVPVNLEKWHMFCSVVIYVMHWMNMCHVHDAMVNCCCSQLSRSLRCLSADEALWLQVISNIKQTLAHHQQSAHRQLYVLFHSLASTILCITRVIVLGSCNVFEDIIHAMLSVLGNHSLQVMM